MMNSDKTTLARSNFVTITLDDYRDVGGLAEALSTHADEVLGRLTDEQRRIAQMLFRRLTERGDGRRDRRRPSPLDDVAAVAAVTTEEVKAVVEEFRKPDRSFITPPHGSILLPKTVLDISHESLISLWDTLGEWVEEEARSAAAYDRLKKTAYLWDAKDADPWGGITLERALTWKATQAPSLAWARRYGSDADYDLATKFLDASESAWLVHQQNEAKRIDRERQDEIERQRLKDKAKNAWKFKLLTAALGLFAVGALGASFVAVSESKNAASQTVFANASAAVAEAKRLEAEKSAKEAGAERLRAEQAAQEAHKEKLKAEQFAREAAKQTKLAQANEDKAIRQEMLATGARLMAEMSAKRERVQKELAEQKALEATHQGQIAQRLQGQAEESARVADSERKKAEEAANEAKILAEEAKQQRDEADKQRKIAEATVQKLREETALVAELKGEIPTRDFEPTSIQRNGKLKLDLVDVYGNLLPEAVSVVLRNQTVNDTNKVTVKASLPTTIAGLLAYPRGVYRVEMNPSSYQPISRFVTIKPNEITNLSVTFPINPAKVTTVTFPAFDKLPPDAQHLLVSSDNVLGFENNSGEALYSNLDDISRAGLLNIVAKARATPLKDGRNVLQLLKEITELSGDRFFASVSDDLRLKIKESVSDGLFTEVSGALRYPPAGFQPGGSFKTTDPYGSLQITFSVKGENWIADLDIDDSGGLGHVFQVNSSFISGRIPPPKGIRTHPYDIHEILVGNQKIDPGYQLLP